LDQRDLALTALELEAATRVDVVSPQLEIRKVRDVGAAGERAGLRPDDTDLEVLRVCGAETDRAGKYCCGGESQYRSSFHDILPRLNVGVSTDCLVFCFGPPAINRFHNWMWL